MSNRARKISRRERSRETERQPGDCLFCGKNTKMTGEHIFGDWLHNLGLKGKSILEVSQDDGEPQRRELPAGSLFSKRLRIVCEPCNNGWMSGLEEAAKPYLLDMFSGRVNIPLDEGAQLVLARWAFKTIAVVNQIVPSPIFPLAHCHELSNSERPLEHAQIWIGSASVNISERWEQISEFYYARRAVDAPIGNDTMIPFPIYVSRFRLINVVFDIIGNWPNEFGLAMQADLAGPQSRALLPIWPSKFPMIWWPPVTSLNTVGGVRGLATNQLVGPAFPPRWGETAS
jgi:hypothetical protein